jgi:5-methylcytosine-specific restriction endonuclease McrA
MGYRKITMTSERIKEIQEKTAYPDSIGVQQALLQVWNECKREPEIDKQGLPNELSFTAYSVAKCNTYQEFEKWWDSQELLIEEPKEESDWINVRDQLPEENEHRCSGDVLIYYSLGLILIGFTHMGNWKSATQILESEEVICWRYLPEPPKNK